MQVSRWTPTLLGCRRTGEHRADLGVLGAVGLGDSQPANGHPAGYPDRASAGRRHRTYEHEDTLWHHVTVPRPCLPTGLPDARKGSATSTSYQIVAQSALVGRGTPGADHRPGPPGALRRVGTAPGGSKLSFLAGYAYCTGPDPQPLKPDRPTPGCPGAIGTSPPASASWARRTGCSVATASIWPA